MSGRVRPPAGGAGRRPQPPAQRPALAAHPCQAKCDWAAAGRAGGRPLFRCAGCGSEWTAAELWTPAQADGTVPPAVAAERERAAAAAVTSGRGGDAAGRSGRNRTSGS